LLPIRHAPPQAPPAVLAHGGENGSAWRRLVVEKPFGGGGRL
jgi:hypothetical protein